MADPVAVFTVDLPDDGASFDVIVHATVADLHDATEPGIGAVTERSTTFHVPGSGDGFVVAPECGTIHFALERFTTGVIAHEAVHMAVAVHQNRAAREVGYRPDLRVELDDTNDEDFAWTVGEIVRAIVAAGYERNLFP